MENPMNIKTIRLLSLLMVFEATINANITFINNTGQELYYTTNIGASTNQGAQTISLSGQNIYVTPTTLLANGSSVSLPATGAILAFSPQSFTASSLPSSYSVIQTNGSSSSMATFINNVAQSSPLNMSTADSSNLYIQTFPATSTPFIFSSTQLSTPATPISFTNNTGMPLTVSGGSQNTVVLQNNDKYFSNIKVTASNAITLSNSRGIS